MGEKVVKLNRDAGALWRPAGARLPREMFAQGMALVTAGQGKQLAPEALAAYWLALAQVDPDDFHEGTRLALQRERFMTPAAMFEACEEARQTRERRAAEERWREDRRREAVERNEQRQALAVRREALRIQADSWTVPPADVEELRARVVVLLELAGRPSVLYLARHAELSGTVEDLVITVEHGSFFRDAARIVGDAASEAAGHPVRVTVREAGSPLEDR